MLDFAESFVRNPGTVQPRGEASGVCLTSLATVIARETLDTPGYRIPTGMRSLRSRRSGFQTLSASSVLTANA